MNHSIDDVKLEIPPEYRANYNRIGVFNTHFQNFKNFGIPKAQLIIADVPYNISNFAYASNPSWYIDGDNKKGESELAGKEFFDTDIELCLYLYEHQLDIYKNLLEYLSEEYDEMAD